MKVQPHSRDGTSLCFAHTSGCTVYRVGSAIVEQASAIVCDRRGELPETYSRLQELPIHPEAAIDGKSSTALIPAELQDVFDGLDQTRLSNDSSDLHDIALTTTSRGRIPATLTVTEITYEGTPTLILRIDSDDPPGGQQLPSDTTVLLGV